MTREELIEKRKRKKRKKRLMAAAAAAVICIAGIGIYRSGSTMRTKARTASAVAAESDTEDAELAVPADIEEPVSVPEEPEAVVTGWQNDEKGRFYLDESGNRITGWFTDPEGGVYLFGDDGYAKTGWQEPDIGRVWFDENGRMVTGLVTIDGLLYYFGYDGVSLTGWQDDGDDTYYFSEETGAAVTGWQVINGEDCWFGEDGLYDPSVKKEVIDGPAVALTFDDGPGEYTNRLLDILERYDANATFFMIGEQVEYYADAVRREHDMGMEQGNHSWDHRTLTHLSDEDIQSEISSTNDVIRRVTGEEPTLFRPPGGGYNQAVFDNSFGMPVILWSIDTLDWSTKNADSTYNSVMSQVKDGDIILMHEIYEASVDAAERLIPALKEKGFRLVTVSQLASLRGAKMTSGTTYGHFYHE